MKMEHKIDCEPLWVNLVPLLLDMKDKEMAKEEIIKMAVIADVVRQAQKNNKKLILHPDGKVEEV